MRLTIDRVFWGVVMLLYLVWRQRGWTDPKPLQAADKAALAFVAYLAVRTLLTDPHGTGLTPVVNLVLWYVMPLGIYWVVRQSRIDRPQNTMILACLTLFGIYLAVTVIAERFEAYCPGLSALHRDLDDRQDGRIRGARPRSPVASHRHRHPAGGLFQRGLDVLAALRRWGRCGVVLAAAGFRPGLLQHDDPQRVDGRRAGAGGDRGAEHAVEWRVPVLGAAVLLAGAVAAANWEQFVAFKRDKNLTARETADSVTLRPVMARVAWLMVLDRPLWGCGFGQYLPEHENYLADRSTELVLEKSRPYSPHNLLFGIVTETGLVGLGLFLALLAALGIRCLAAVALPSRRRSGCGSRGCSFSPCLSAYLVNGMFHHIALIPMSNILLFFAAGMNAAVRRSSRGTLRVRRLPPLFADGNGEALNAKPRGRLPGVST